MSEEVQYEEFLSGLESKWGSFLMEAKAGRDNKTAALRARKLSMALRIDMKDFRVLSCSNDRVLKEEE